MTATARRQGRALLIAPRFFGYENEIRDQMSRDGWIVDMLPDRSFDTALLKAVARIAPILVEPSANRFYAAAARRLAAGGYDLILVIQGECVFEPTLRLLRSTFPAARLVFYTWDSLSNKPRSEKQLRFYDECLSFDEADAARLRMRFRPLFFLPGFERVAPGTPAHDISFVGTIHSDRYRIVRQIAAQLPDAGRACWYLYLQAPWMYAARKVFTRTIAGSARSEFHFEALPRAAVQAIFLGSRAVLDIEHPRQRGLTMRTLEALGSQTKLVTTNATVGAYDFHDPQNIAIIQRDDPRLPAGFLSTPFRPVPDAIKDRYRLATWVREVCGQPPHADPADRGPQLHVAVEDAPPERFLALCWEVFFESRGRGITLQAHFPWLQLPGQACFVTLRSGEDVVAGCAIRFMADATGQRRAAAIGLVCVARAHRGQGHAARVLERAIAHADALGLADLVLWTRQPGLYARHGFEPDDDALLGTVTGPVATAPGSSTVLQRAWPGGGDERGLPPFASRGVAWRSSTASAIVLHDANGAILAEWAGADADVADLLAQALPADWRMNALASDTLPRTLADRGPAVHLEPAGLRMIRSLGGQAAERRAWPLRVLDRI